MNRGFTKIVLIIVLVVAIVGVGVWYSNKSRTQTTIDTVANWKTYRSVEYGFEFKYPPNLSVETLSVSGPDGSEDYQFYIQGLTEGDSRISYRLVGVLDPARFANNQEKLASLNQYPPSKAARFSKVEKDFFNLGKAIFYEGGFCGADYQTIIRGGYSYSFFYSTKCSDAQQVPGIMDTFKFTK